MLSIHSSVLRRVPRFVAGVCGVVLVLAGCSSEDVSERTVMEAQSGLLLDLSNRVAECLGEEPGETVKYATVGFDNEAFVVPGETGTALFALVGLKVIKPGQVKAARANLQELLGEPVDPPISDEIWQAQKDDAAQSCLLETTDPTASGDFQTLSAKLQTLMMANSENDAFTPVVEEYEACVREQVEIGADENPHDFIVETMSEAVTAPGGDEDQRTWYQPTINDGEPLQVDFEKIDKGVAATERLWDALTGCGGPFEEAINEEFADDMTEIAESNSELLEKFPPPKS